MLPSASRPSIEVRFAGSLTDSSEMQPKNVSLGRFSSSQLSAKVISFKLCALRNNRLPVVCRVEGRLTVSSTVAASVGSVVYSLP